MIGSILALDDDSSVCDLIRDSLTAEGFRVETTTRDDAALTLLDERDFDVVITDLNLQGKDGLTVCREVLARRPDTAVIVITAFGTMESAIAAIRAGAYDFVSKPFDVRDLALTARRAAEHRRLRGEVQRLREQVDLSQVGVGQLIGECTSMQRVYDLVKRVAVHDASVIISGESGTGKELVARAVHAGSERKDKPFIAINCGAISETLLESELFGHVRGAFTDAKASRQGLFEQADGGTLFLDEVGEMPLGMQVKLLRVLQERVVRPVGGNTEVHVDVRLIAATNRDLQTEVDQGRFREDLYYRLNVVNLQLPPLRNRGNDILLLAQHFIDKLAHRLQKPVTGISADAARKMLEYDWPGNVRQLENCIERAITLTRYEQLTVEDLPESIRRHQSTDTSVPEVAPEHMPTLSTLERRYIEKVLRVSKDNKTLAASILGVDRRTLYRKLQRFAAAEAPEPAKKESNRAAA
jgi:two-component system response regulator HydG